jgi:hypothetical protein
MVRMRQESSICESELPLRNLRLTRRVIFPLEMVLLLKKRRDSSVVDFSATLHKLISTTLAEEEREKGGPCPPY